PDGAYVNTPGEPAYMDPTSYGYEARIFLNDPLSAADQTVLADQINALQDPETGSFRRRPEPTEADRQRLYDGAYWRQTSFALFTLHMVEATPRYPIRFVEPYRDPKKMLEFISDPRWWGNDGWGGSTEVCAIHRLIRWRRWATNDWLDAYFGWLNERQDPETGYWSVEDAADLWPGFGCTYHLLQAYYQEQRPIRYVDRILETTLRLQYDGDPTGHWQSNHSAMDALNLFVCLAPFIADRSLAARIDRATVETAAAVLATQNPDGGLCQGRQPERRGKPLAQDSDMDATRYGVAALIQARYVDGVFCNAVCRAHWPW
ncbi:MAG: hypothetical protein ACRDI2_21455, partial [Chloroflexota bacterium]